VTLAGTLATTNGGTGLTSFTSGGAVYATSTSALTTGTLPTTAGGTGLTSFTANGVVYASSSSALTTGSALRFDGTNLITRGILPDSNDAYTLGTSSLKWNNIFTNALSDGTDQLVGSSGTTVRFGFGASWTGLAFAITGTEQMRLTSTGLGIGTSSPSVKLDVSGAASTNSESRFVAKLADTSAVAQGNGGGIVFRGVYTGTTLVDAAGVQAYKANATDNNYSYGLAFVTRADGGNLTANMRLDQSGNLGLGVTPSAWGTASSRRAIELPGGGSIWGQNFGGSNPSMQVYSNAYESSTGPKYTNSSQASGYQQNAGIHAWFTAPSGTAGNAITFTQAMTLDASGNLGIGTSSPANPLNIVKDNTAFRGQLSLQTVSASNFAQLTFYDQSTLSGQIYQAYGSDKSINIVNPLAHGIAFWTTNTERMRLDSSGNLGIGTTSIGAGTRLSVAGGNIVHSGIQFNFNPGASTQYEFVNRNGAGFDFYVNNAATLAARIDSSGNLLVGTTSNTDSNRVNITQSSATSCLGVGAGTSGNMLNWYNNAGGYLATVSHSGAVVIYGTGSDYRLKNITGPITTSGSYIDSLNPVEGTWKADGSTFVGLIAHEVQEVSRTPVATGEKDGEKMQGMDYSSSEIIANLIAEIQSLRKRLAAAGI
jgi:hypothetical protein